MLQRGHARHLAVLATVMLAATLLATAMPVSAATTTYFARNGGQEAVLSQLTTDPGAMRIGDKTYVGYQGPGFDPWMAVYDSGDESWAGPYKMGYNPLRLDAHGAPALYLDPSNRIHAFYGGHNTAIRHARAPLGTPSSWTQLSSLSAGTYPQVVDEGGGSMLLFYRRSGMDWVVRSSSNGASSFGAETEILHADSLAWWYGSLREGTGDRLHLAFTWLDYRLLEGGQLFSRRHAYYAYRDSVGTWRGADGVGLTLPIGLAEANAHCRVYDSGSSEYVNEVVFGEDESGEPCLLFLVGSGSGPGSYDWRFMRKSGTSWTSSTITTTDHYFDAATFEVLPDGTVDVYLVTGDSDAVGSQDADYRGRGGRIEHWSSADSGLTWSKVERISPVESGVIYSDPILVSDGGADARVVFSDWTQDESNPFHRMFLWGDGGLVPRESPEGVTRLAGYDRARTSIEISREAFPDGARTAILATQGNYIDALVGAPLASERNAPILLTNPTRLTSQMAEEIDRLKPREVIVLGGTDVVSNGVVSAALARSSVKSVVRAGGDNRFDTALVISRLARDPTRNIGTALVVSGRNWPDAAAAGALSVANDWPIVLADGNWLPPQSATILKEWDIDSTVVVGQTDVVGPRVASLCPNPYRIGGDDRFATAALLSEYGLSHGLLADRMVVATGLSWPDALSGSTLAGRSRAPILFAWPGDLSAPSRTFLETHGDKTVDVWVLGGSDVVGDGVADDIEQILESR